MAEVSGSFPGAQGDAGKCMATAAEEEAFDYLTNMKLVMDMHQKSNSFLFKTMLEKSLFSSPAACIKTIDERVKRLAKNASDQTGASTGLKASKAALERLVSMQFSRYQRLLQLLRSADYGWHNGEDADDRIVIFTNASRRRRTISRSTLRQESQNYRKKAIVSMDGGIVMWNSRKIVEDFGTGSRLYILVASDVASEGLNLHYLEPQTHPFRHSMIVDGIPSSVTDASTVTGSTINLIFVFMIGSLMQKFKHILDPAAEGRPGA